jgi:hypothetical protein
MGRDTWNKDKEGGEKEKRKQGKNTNHFNVG